MKKIASVEKKPQKLFVDPPDIKEASDQKELTLFMF